MIKAKLAALALIVSCAAPAVSAQSLVFGLGTSDYNRDRAVDAAVATIDWRAAPFWTRGGFSTGLDIGAMVDGADDIYVGIGLYGHYRTRSPWFIEAAVLPGAHFEDRPGNSLGSRFNILSRLGVGYALGNGRAVSLAVSHISNASTADRNPGANFVTLRWHTSF